MPKKDEELAARIAEAAEIAEEIAGPVVDAARKPDDPDEVRIKYRDGRTNKVSRQIAVELVARGQARVV